MAIKNSKNQVDILKNNAVVKMTGAIDNDGNIDIDAIAEELMMRIQNHGIDISVPLLGKINMNSNDVENLLNHIKNS